MEKTKLVLILHGYQPPYPVQEKEIVERIIQNTYLPFAKKLVESEGIKVILNINASLTEMLQIQSPETLEMLKRGLDDGKLEFLESGAYHPILPLIPPKFVIQQLELNRKINQEAFGSKYQPTGVFPPELAMDQPTLDLLTSESYDYVVVANNSLTPETDGKLPHYIQGEKSIYLISRNRTLSNAIAFKQFGIDHNAAVNRLRQGGTDPNLPIVLAMDIETFGEHHSNYHEFLFQLLMHPNIETLHFSDIDKSQSPVIEGINPSSWSTEDQDINNHIPFPLWDHPNNALHTLQHAHFDLMINTFNEIANGDIHTDLLKAQHSCQFWWADRNGRWGPEMIRKGMDLQRKVLLDLTNSESIINTSDRLYKRLIRTLATN